MRRNAGTGHPPRCECLRRIGRTAAGVLFGIAAQLHVAPSHAATATLPPDALLVDARSVAPATAKIEDAAARALARIARHDPQGAYAELRGLSDVHAFEAAAVRVIEQLQPQPASAAGDALLEQLSAEPVRVFRRHDETAADWFVPLYDVGKRAASARMLHQRELRRLQAMLQLRDDPHAALLGPSGSGDDAKRAEMTQPLCDALEQAPPDLLERSAAVALSQPSRVPACAWPRLARHAHDARVLAAALDHAVPAELLPKLGAFAADLDDAQALAWLRKAARHPSYASAAVLALGALSVRSSEAEAELVSHLGDPHTGPSAAAALAQWPQAERMHRLDALIAAETSPARLADLALALRLEGSHAALARLRQLASDTRLPAAVRAELQR